MAKGLRSSTNKANKSRLRARVFGPVENARIERLSSALLEVASKAKKHPGGKSEANGNHSNKDLTSQKLDGSSDPSSTVDRSTTMELDVDDATSKSRGTTSGVVQRKRKRKGSSIVFKVGRKHGIQARSQKIK